MFEQQDRGLDTNVITATTVVSVDMTLDIKLLLLQTSLTQVSTATLLIIIL